MNIKPSHQQVIDAVKATQDGSTLNPNDIYSKFILDLIKGQTEANIAAIDAGEVDTEELESDIGYAIYELKKALQAIQSFNK